MASPEIRQIPLTDLWDDEGQPRHGLGDRVALDALKASMDQLGRTVQYVTVSPLYGGGFRVVSGHRRVQAARELGWEWLPAIVVDDVADEVDRRLRQIAENSARAALKPIELCEAIDELRGRVEPPRIAGATGVSLRTVYNYVGILEHPDLVEELRGGRPLRAVLVEVSARNRPVDANDGASTPDDKKARRNARRRAARTIGRLAEIWPALHVDDQQALAAQLRDLLSDDSSEGLSDEPSEELSDTALSSATLHSEEAESPENPLLRHQEVR